MSIIQHNMTAINANRYLGINNKKLSKSLEKLSSGYKINRAGDDAAGLAVSEKMRSQIAGMQQGVKNAQDGISMVQTFEGALTETHNILNRMKTLATQMSNGTYDNEVDRGAAQNEFKQLNDELNQIADTDFNGVVVLNGGRMADGHEASSGLSTLPSMGTASGSSGTSPITYSNTTSSVGVEFGGNSNPQNGDKATQVTFGDVTLALAAGVNETAENGTMDGQSITVKTDDTGISYSGTGTGIAGNLIVTKDYAVTSVPDGFAIAGKTPKTQVTIDGKTYYSDTAVGVNAGAANNGWYDDRGVTVDLTTALTDTGNGVTAAAGANKNNTLQISYTIDLSKYKGSQDSDVSKSNSMMNGKRNLTYANSVTLQVGARSKDAVKFTFAYQCNGMGSLQADLDCSARGLGTSKLDIKTQENANFAIDQIDNAINKVSMVRSTFGAIQNRLDHKIDNLNVSVENLTSAESQIRDTNMAEEMMNFTKSQILAQASQSMLAQANQIPQGVLSLLQ